MAKQTAEQKANRAAILATKKAEAKKALPPIGHVPSKDEIASASAAFIATKKAITAHANQNGYSDLPHCEYAAQTAGYMLASGVITVDDNGVTKAVKISPARGALMYGLLTNSARTDMVNRRVWFTSKDGALSALTEKGRAAMQARFQEYAAGKRDYRCSVAQARIVAAAVIAGNTAKFKDGNRDCSLTFKSAVTVYE